MRIRWIIWKDFVSCEAAVTYWDTHDTTDDPDAFSDVEVDIDLKGRRFDIDIEEDVMVSLRREARKNHLRPGRMASRLQRKGLTATGAF